MFHVERNRNDMEFLETCPVCTGSKFTDFITCKDHLVSGKEFHIITCSDCGFRFTNPRPAAEKLGEYYQSREYISHSDSRQGLFNQIYQAVRKFTISKKLRLIRSLSPKGSILDIGCATGDFLLKMKSEGWEVTGIEPEAGARAKAVKRGIRVEDERYLMQVPDHSFDVITLWHVLEHVALLPERMKTIHRILKPGGILIIAVPNCKSRDAEHYQNFWAGYDVPRHLYHFTRETMLKLLAGSGFTTLGIRPMMWDSFYVSLLSEKNKSGKLKWIPGFWYGFSSNIFAIGNGEYSSLIYLAKKPENELQPS